MTIDHLVYTAPDLEAAIDDLEHRLGVRAAMGGCHPGRGTRNALIALSEYSYLEIVARDPTQNDIAGTRWFGIDALAAPRLATWAVKSANIHRTTAEVAHGGVELGPVAAGSRQTPDGTVLRWQVTDPGAMVADGLVPFLIDWGTSPHPASSAPRGPVLLSLRGEHPEPERVARALSAVGVTMPVVYATQPALIATLGTAHGEIEL